MSKTGKILSIWKYSLFIKVIGRFKVGVLDGGGLSGQNIEMESRHFSSPVSVSGHHTDINPSHWLWQMLPKATWPYLSLMRLDRPIGTWLLLLPAWWSLALGQASFFLYGLFAIGAVLMRGAGCVVNDLWDKDFDRQVERTKTRPLASGELTSRQAIMFLAGLLSVGLLILIQLSPLAIALGVVSLGPVILYPLAKRITWYPQAVLGLTFNFGALMGYAAATGDLAVAPVFLYVAGIFWTLGYDTIYAHQDVVDDGVVGVKSTARKFGQNSPRYIAVFYILTAGLIFTAGLVQSLHFTFYIFWAAAAFHLMWQIRTWEMEDSADCLRKFRSNRDFGWLVFVAILCGVIFQA